MIAGPAVPATLLTVARTHGVIAFALNLLVVWVVLSWAPLV